MLKPLEPGKTSGNYKCLEEFKLRRAERPVIRGMNLLTCSAPPNQSRYVQNSFEHGDIGEVCIELPGFFLFLMLESRSSSKSHRRSREPCASES
jgi:hypothetical protein